MSIVRFDRRRFSKGKNNLYVINADQNIDGSHVIYGIALKKGVKNKVINKKGKTIPVINFVGDCSIPTEDFIEVMFRLLEYAEVKFTEDDLNRVRTQSFLKKLPRREIMKREQIINQEIINQELNKRKRELFRLFNSILIGYFVVCGFLFFISDSRYFIPSFINMMGAIFLNIYLELFK